MKINFAAQPLLINLLVYVVIGNVETDTVETSCDELSNSVRLRQLLGIVLTFGNRLNTAGKGKKKKAGAFTLDSLLKLNQAKAFDKKTTFLHYIVLIVQRNNELLLKFKDDLPTVLKADKVFWDQCISDLEEVENQLENVRRIALYQAHHHHKFRVKKRRSHRDVDEDEESLDEVSLTLEQEVEALRSTPIGQFTLSAIKKVSFLRDRVEETKMKFRKLLEYFGEEEKKMQPHELFAIIVRFCKDFEKAKEQVYANEKRKKREERKRQQQANANAQGHPNKTTPKSRHSVPNGRPPHHSSSMPRLSSMQPNASRILDEIKQRKGNTNPQGLQRDPASSVKNREERMPQDTSQAIQDHAAYTREATSPKDKSQSSTSHAPSTGDIDRSRSASSSPRHRVPENQSRDNPPDPPQTSPSHPKNATHSDKHLEDVIPQGMQEQGRMEFDHDGGSGQTNSSNISKDNSFESNGSNLSQLRRRAKLRLQQRATSHGSNSNSSSSSQDPAAYTSINADDCEDVQDPPITMQDSDSALQFEENPYPNDMDCEVDRTSGNANPNVNNQTNHMRNRMRQRRLLERKQRLLSS